MLNSAHSLTHSLMVTWPWYLVIGVHFTHSPGQLTSHHWPSFGKGENKGSVLLWCSSFDRPNLMFLMREGLQSGISIFKHCLMRLWIDINQLTFVLPFAETRSVDVSWPREYTSEMSCNVGKSSFYITNLPARLSLAIPLWVGVMNTSYVNCWER